MKPDENKKEKLSGFKYNSQKDSEDKKPKNAVGGFFSKIGYSVWVIVLVIGGLIAFGVSLLLL